MNTLKQNPPDFPAGLPLLPVPDEGHEWKYRPPEWLPRPSCVYIFAGLNLALGEWVWIQGPLQGNAFHYAELVKIEELDWKTNKYQTQLFFDWLENPGLERDWLNGEAWTPVAHTDRNWNTLRLYRRRPEPIDPYKELKEAHARGEVIQIEMLSGWLDLKRPDWTANVNSYRIKPTPKLVPLEASDIPAVCWLRVGDGDCFPVMVLQVRPDGVFFCAPDGFSDKGVSREKSYSQLLQGRWQYSTDRKTWLPYSKESI